MAEDDTKDESSRNAPWLEEEPILPDYPYIESGAGEGGTETQPGFILNETIITNELNKWYKKEPSILITGNSTPTEVLGDPQPVDSKENTTKEEKKDESTSKPTEGEEETETKTDEKPEVKTDEKPEAKKPAEQQAETPTQKTQQKSNLTDNKAELYINEEFAKSPDPHEPFPFDNGQAFKITAFFAPKFAFDKNVDYFVPSQWTYLRFNHNLKSIVIEDKIARFGIRGHIDIDNTGEILNFILDRLNCYYLVINFTLVEGDGGVKFEPYILEVTNVSNIVDNTGQVKQLLRLDFVDIITYICQQHSMASVIKFDPNISEKRSYREVFEVITDYVKRFIKVNYNGLYSFKKDLIFKKDYDGNTVDVEKLVKHSFQKMDPTCTIYEGLDILLRDCASPIRSYEKFKDKFNDFDYMLVPMFYKEEYPDICGLYQRVFDPVDASNFQDVSSNFAQLKGRFADIVKKREKTLGYLKKAYDFTNGLFNNNNPLRGKGLLQMMAFSQFKNDGQTVIKNFNGTNYTMLLRPLCLRDIHMPFRFAFAFRDTSIISESINPSVDEKGNYTPKEQMFFALNGRWNLGINNYRYFPTSQNLVQKMWKNMVITNSGLSQNQSSTVLIEFNWIFQYYIYNFLGKGYGNIDQYTSNITPSFFIAYKNGSIDNQSMLQDFHEMNANFTVIRSETDLNEALVHIGKNLCSFVIQNDTYQFTIRGNIFRHPNEIIKVSNTKETNSTNPNIALNTDLARNDYIMMYVTSVTHVWEGNKYYNNISANKIYERLLNDTLKEF